MKSPSFCFELGSLMLGVEKLEEESLIARQLATVCAQPPDGKMLLPATPVQRHA